MSFKVSSLEFPWNTATSNRPRVLSVESITVSESGREWCFLGREAQEPRKGGNYISPLGFRVCSLGLVSQSRYHTPGSSKQQNIYFPRVLEARGLQSRCWQGWPPAGCEGRSHPRPLSWACRRPLSPWVFTSIVHSLCLSVSKFLIFMRTRHVGLESTLMASSSFDNPSKDPTSK